MHIWGIESGIQEIDEQIHSLGKELAGKFEFKSIALKPMWRYLNILTGFIHDSFFEKGVEQLTAPWPDIVINGHPSTASLAVLIKQRSEHKIFIVNIHTPGAPLVNFDLVICPEHNKIKGSNIFTITGQLTTIKPEILDKNTYSYTYDHLKPPFIFVVGREESQTFLLSEEELSTLTRDLVKFQEKTEGTLIISHKIDPDGRLKENLETFTSLPHLALTKTDSLVGALAWADILICVGDEIATLSRACSTGKTVLHYKLDRTPPIGFMGFYEKLISRKMISTTEDNWKTVSYSPLREAERVANHINLLLQKKQKVNVLL